MKRRKTSQPQQWLSSSTMIYFNLLPNDCLERIFTFLIKDNPRPRKSLDTLSLVSKQFLSITDRYRFSLRIDNQISPFLPRLLTSLSNLNSLNFSCYNGRLDQLLREISCFPLNITSLNLSYQPTIPDDGLRAFSQKITTLTSLTCSHIDDLDSTDLLLIADCFPLLEELDLGFGKTLNCNSSYGSYLDAIETLSLALYKLRKINLSCHDYVNDRSLFRLFKNGKLLEEVILFNCYRNMSVEKPNCLKDLVVCPELKSLNLSFSVGLRDESLITFASVFPNLEVVDLSYCTGISEEGVCEMIDTCDKIREFNLRDCWAVNLHALLDCDRLCEINMIGVDR